MKKLYRVLAFICALVALFALFMIIKELCEREEDKKVFEDVLSLALTPDGSEEEQSLSTPSVSEEESDIPPSINMSIVKEENPDCVSWIYVEGTRINYPVMLTPDEPEKYIDKNFYGKKSQSGTPFLDGRCTLDCDNLIIYGHNMLNGTMFADLQKYLDSGFTKAHGAIYLYTPEGAREYELFAVVLIKSDDAWYSFINGGDGEIIENICKKSLYKAKAETCEESRFITLSTCYGRERDDRLIVVGRIK